MQDDNRQPTPGVHENFASDIAKPAHGSRNGLLPCPFCGGVGDFSEVNAWWVRCDQCNAETEAFMSPEEATEAWNRRTPAPQSHVEGTKECECFGGSGLHASTHVLVGSDREHCDLCGYPVPEDRMS